MNENSRMLLERLAEARRLEKAQTLFYRSLAAEAEDRGLASESERLNELHADEQHHLSRLTARVLELGGDPEDLPGGLGVVELDGWEERARQREDQEIEFYRALMEEGVLDEDTRAVVEKIAESERQHRQHLGGKWMSA